MRGDRSGSVSTNGRLFSQTNKGSSIMKGMSLKYTLKTSAKSPPSTSDYAPLGIYDILL